MAFRSIFGFFMLLGGLWISHMMRGAGDAIRGYDAPETLEYEMNRPAAEVFTIIREVTQHPTVHTGDTFVSDSLQITAVRGESIRYHMKVTDQDKGLNVTLEFKDSENGKSILMAKVDVPTFPSGRKEPDYVTDEFLTRKLDDAFSELTTQINDSVPIESGAISVNHEIASADTRLRQWRENYARQMSEASR
jgi:hypothetical protein